METDLARLVIHCIRTLLILLDLGPIVVRRRINTTSKLAWAAAFLLMALHAAAACAEEAQVPAIKRMDDATRAKVLAALAGLIILGFGMVALIWLGARVTQRYRQGSSVFRPTPRPGEHDWARKPLDEE